MPRIKQCVISFENVPSEGEAQLTWQAGTNPSRFQLKFVLGSRFPQIGTLRLSDGTRTVAFPGCRVVREVVQSVGKGRMRLVTLEDRRWVWQQSRIWGVYNRDDKGAKTTEDRKTARELAELCLIQMGERGFDVRALPTDVFPTVNWDAENAAAALDQICSQFGCVVTLSAYRDRAVIWKENDGPRPRVNSQAMDATPANEPQVVPPALIFEGGPTRWLADVPLEPVGLEKVDDREVIKAIDDLSYKPSSGWESQDPRSFVSVDADQRDLARRSIWRMFRVKTPFEVEAPPHLINDLDDNTEFEIEAGELWRVLPLGTQMPSAAGLDTDGVPRDAKLVGAFAAGKSVRDNNTTASNYSDWSSAATTPQLPQDDDSIVWSDGFSIDATRGIVTTSQPCYWLNSGEHEAPALRLRTSIGLRSRTTRQWLSQRYNLRLRSPTRGALYPELIKQEEVIFEILQGRYTTPDDSGDYQTLTNASRFIALAQVYLRERLNALYPDTAISIPYKGFNWQYDVTGSIRTITWRAGPQGGSTVVEYAMDRPDLRFTEKQLRRQAEQLSTARDLQAANRRLAKLLASQKKAVV